MRMKSFSGIVAVILVLLLLLLTGLAPAQEKAAPPPGGAQAPEKAATAQGKPASGADAAKEAKSDQPDIGKLPSKIIITGTINTVSPQKRLVVLRLVNGKTKTYAIEKDAWILRGKLKARLADFRVGENVALGVCSPLNSPVLRANLVMDEETHREYAAKKVPPTVYATSSGKTASSSTPAFLPRTGGQMTAAPSPTQLPAMPPEGPAPPGQASSTPSNPMMPGAQPYGASPSSVMTGGDEEDEESGSSDFRAPTPAGAGGMQVAHIQGRITQIFPAQRLVYVQDISTGATVQVRINARVPVRDVRTQQLVKFENLKVGNILDAQGLQTGPLVEASTVYIQ